MEIKNNEIVVATRNRGKILEFQLLLKKVPAKFLSLLDFDPIVEVEEIGSTFQENAVLKARGYALQTGKAAIADDSGLEVHSLGNAPGIRSARYGGDDMSFPDKINLLLNELNATGNRDRSARFVCSIAVSDHTGQIIGAANGFCNGHISAKPAGINGFGYDPIFIPLGYTSSFGELSEQIKSKISHRARASEAIIRYLLDYIAV